ncbi:MAG: enoyl-[acyl-carrier-protein] reductase (NADH), partial [Ilumatobacter sp.]
MTMALQLLTDKKILITGVVNIESIAYATAVAASKAGAHIVLSGLQRDIEHTQSAAAT